MSIKLSPKHGLNPSIGVCFICGEDSGEIILPGLITKKNSLGHPEEVEAPHRAIWHSRPCPKCEGHMKQGILLLSVRDGEKGNNPHRTGRFAVVKEEAIEKVFHPDIVEDILKKRMCFVEDCIWERIGLPT